MLRHAGGSSMENVTYSVLELLKERMYGDTLSDGIYYYSNDSYDDNSTDGSGESCDGLLVSQVLYCLLFCLGFLGNSMVLWILLGYIKLRTMSDICLLNLTLSDLILAITIPLWGNVQGLVSCKIITGIYQLGFYSEALFVGLMSVDRYLAVVHAVKAMRIRTMRCGIIASIIIWTVCVVMAIPQVIFASIERDQENCNTISCYPKYPNHSLQSWKMQRNFSEISVSLFLCLPILTFCYVKILIVLSKSRTFHKNRAEKLIFTIVCVFVLCWVPYDICVLLETLQLFQILNNETASEIISVARNYAEIIALSHCCVNPFIYAFVGEKFRKYLVNWLTRYLCWTCRGRRSLSHRDVTDRETSNTPVKSDY